MILWFMDRFGLPGSYQRIWVKLMAEQGINVKEVRIISLHKALNRTLLTKYGTRKAPTWIPEEGPSIMNMIDGLIFQHRPRAVVLSAPEALACLGLNPEHATLHNLRGSVYWRSGLPHLVMLPMSAWNLLVSQKEIGAANYGYESQEAFAAAHTAGGTGATVESERGPHGARDGTRAADGRDSGSGAGQGSPTDRESIRLKQTGRLDSPGSNPLAGVDLASAFRNAIQGSGVGGAGLIPPHVRDQAGDSVLDRQSGGRGGATDGSSDGVAASGIPEPDEGRPGLHAVGDERVSEDDLPYIVDGRPETDELDDEAGESGDSETDAGGDDATADEEGGDQFFYEPVLSPVGRFVITADAAKLKRILESGRKAAGPNKPLVLNWR